MADADPAVEQVSLASFSDSEWAHSVRRARSAELGAIGTSIADLETTVDGDPLFSADEWQALSPEKQADVLVARLKRIEKRVEPDEDDTDDSDAECGQPRWYQ